MGRRSVHTPEELRELILKAATEIIESDGLAGLSAREIARRIEYSPGTLYNVFDNLDDLILTIEARLLDQLAAKLSNITTPAAPNERIHHFTETYIDFTRENPKLWNLLFEHRLPPGRETPEWYRNKLEVLLMRVEDALAPLTDKTSTDDQKRAARAIWAGIHGITSLSTTTKLSSITGTTVGPLVRDLVSTYLAGLNRDKI